MKRPTAAVGSAVFFIVAPCVVAGVVPWLLTRWEFGPPWPAPALIAVIGVVIMVAGAAVLGNAFVRFAWEGRGTPAPVAPTEELVITGPYRWVRNPMYLAVVAAIIGQALLLRQVSLLIYGAVVAAAFFTFVKSYEERVLSERYGEAYRRYRAAVPGWIPRPRRWQARRR
jgi:protein-S-isoprenylcysteine O-methyltransferase Ste14